MSGLAPRLRSVARVVAGVGLVLLLVLVRVLVSARTELARADSLLRSNDLDGAMVHYRRAARWYAPASPYHVRALDQLERIGAQRQAQGDSARALSAYRALRGAILATRSFYVPEAARLEAANQRIASLMAEQPAPGMDAGKSQAQLRAEHLALLEAVPGPNPFWTCVLLFGFAAWVAAAFAFSVRGIDAEDRFVAKEVRRWGTLMVLGFALFVLGMVLA